MMVRCGLRVSCVLKLVELSTGQQKPPIRPLVDIVGKGKKKDMKVMGSGIPGIH